MAITPWLSSDKLVAAIKRKISFPSHQATFTDDELLAFSNEEMMISQVPSVLSFHEEYYVTSKLVPLEDGKNRYPIPDRAIGMKLRDLFFVDSNGNYFEMARVSSEDKAFFQSSSSGNGNVYRYYLEGNDIVLTEEIVIAPSASLLFNYFIRPNQLVAEERAAISSAFTKTITLTNASIVASDTVTIGDVVFTAVAGAPGANQFQIGASSADTATNLTATISTNGTYTATVASNVVSVDYEVLDTSLSTSNSAGFSIQSTQGIRFISIPSNIVNSAYVDLLQTKPGHKILAIDIKLGNSVVSTNVITFNPSDIPSSFLIGDYVCLQNECIIPYLPTDLHTGLAERTCARILSALGDTAGLADVNAKIAEIEVRQGTILTNRVEGSPKKINGRNSILRYSKSRNRGF
jgi:hypothetical protein